MKQPNDPVAERAVLGLLLSDASLIAQAANELTADDFSIPAHCTIFKEIVNGFEKGEPADVVSIVERLQNHNELERAGGAAYLSSLCDSAGLLCNFFHYLKIIREKSMHRKAIRTAKQIYEESVHRPVEDIYDFLDKAEKMFFDLGKRRNGCAPKPSALLIDRLVDYLENHGLDQDVVKTGFEKLDGLIRGFAPGNLILLAGRPSMGKTSFALNLAFHMAVKQKKRVLFFSLEMTSDEIIRRMVSMESGKDFYSLGRAFVSNNDWGKIVPAASSIRQADFLVSDAAIMTANAIRSEARHALAQAKNSGVVIIDYLQLIDTPQRDRRDEEIASISRSLKATAREINAPVIALSQLNRQVDMREDKTPRLSDLRDSGALEQDADIVLFIHRPELGQKDGDRSLTVITVGKHRNGPVGQVNFKFDEKTCKFTEV